MKKFKTESKKVLDLMINSIYTHKEIFLRELLSNCSDAIDKLYYKSLTGGVSGLSRDDFAITISLDKDNRILTISDNGIGMTKDELDSNLGVIARSGSLDFKQSNQNKEENINIIGQFGVGFYSAFMVAKKVIVDSRAYGSEEANKWISSSADGYEIEASDKVSYGTVITLNIKDNTDEDNYDDYLDEYTIKNLVKKYSDYIRYPIVMELTKYKENSETKLQEKYTEETTLNAMVPLWKKPKKDVKPEEYNKFYKDMFNDTNDPLKVIHTSAEGAVDYKALLFVPSEAPYNFYTKNYEKGLKLFTNGVMIMEKCADLLPDYFSFVRGVVDSELTLNISRETIQHNRQLKAISNNLEKKIKKELLDLLKNDRESYEKFFDAFGLPIKFALYDGWGANKDKVIDLAIFNSLKEGKRITLDEYVEKMANDQKYIYYGTGKTIDAIKTLPQCDKLSDSGFDILLLTDDVDEFAMKVINTFKEKEFKSIQSSDLGLENEKEVSEEDKELTDYLSSKLEGKVSKVRISKSLKNHPVCIVTEGEVTLEMEKVLKSMPNAGENVAVATKILEISANHAIYQTLKECFINDKEKLDNIAQILYSQALLIEGITLENPTEIADMICKLI
ncbi:MAG: molecular chaperone HtpG [Clostridia bacterium]